MAGYADPVGVLCRQAGRGHRADRRGVLRREPVIVRLSDFKSNEYANLIGGAHYEPDEENPMLGFRGAVALRRRDLQALLRAGVPRAEAGARGYGPTNVQVMVPFVRTVKEAKQVTELLAQNGLKSGVNGLKSS